MMWKVGVIIKLKYLWGMVSKILFSIKFTPFLMSILQNNKIKASFNQSLC